MIENKLLKDSQLATLEVYNTNGRKVFEKQNLQQQSILHIYEIDGIEVLEAGLYIVKFTNGTQNYSGKMIKL